MLREADHLWSEQQAVLHWPVSSLFQRMAMDLLDVKTVNTSGSRYLMVVTACFTKVAKRFDVKDSQQWFEDSSTGYDASQKWFRVLYEDGDAEENSRTEVVKLI